MSQLTKNQARISWVAQLAAAGIYLQTLFFKFTGAPESVHIFEQLGAEPWGRLASGVFELIISVLLLVPATAAAGSVLSMGMISGAILSHLTVLGFEVQNDGGTLFFLACVVFVASAVVAFLRRRELPIVGTTL